MHSPNRFETDSYPTSARSTGRATRLSSGYETVLEPTRCDADGSRFGLRDLLDEGGIRDSVGT